MAVTNAQTQTTQAALSWPGVSLHPHRFGGVEYRLGRRELGHIHGDHLVDIPFPTHVRDEVVAAGLASPHHILPESGWVSLYLSQPGDVQTAIQLLQRSFELAQAQRARRETSATQQG
jgi:hypothetical protein